MTETVTPPIKTTPESEGHVEQIYGKLGLPPNADFEQVLGASAERTKAIADAIRETLDRSDHSTPRT